MSYRHTPSPVHVVGIGGTLRAGSSGEQALRIVLEQVEHLGASTRLFSGTELAQLPMYSPEDIERPALAEEYIAHLRAADAIVIASPGYHGSISGLVKNALDYVEDLREDARPYFADRSVGLVVTAYGWQGGVTTLETMRSIVHALRGWATPYGAVVNSSECRFVDGACTDPKVSDQLGTVAREVVQFARMVGEPGAGELMVRSARSASAPDLLGVR